MGLFRKLLRGGQPADQAEDTSRDARPAWMQDGIRAQLYDGDVDLEVVGESHYQDNLWRLVGGRRSSTERVRVDIYALLVAEIDNPYDANAVSVWIGGLKVGYLSRDDAQRYQPGLLALQKKHGQPIALPGVIVGGGMREDGPGRLGVFLRHDLADFGVPSEAPSHPAWSGIRTGLSNPVATDAADDSYDLAWMDDLPDDEIRAITKLRQLLQREPDPIDRHFMHTQLETLLYRSRDAFASALEEYDEACRQHDSEMGTIRQAFMTKWSQVPWLEIYRQMAIRQQKAKNFEQALWWAERGIAVYGNNAARPEAVEDLQKRAAAYRAKLSPTPRSSPPKVSQPPHPEIETLVCIACGREFQRAPVRGRKPLRCPECRDQGH